MSGWVISGMFNTWCWGRKNAALCNAGCQGRRKWLKMCLFVHGRRDDDYSELVKLIKTLSVNLRASMLWQIDIYSWQSMALFDQVFFFANHFTLTVSEFSSLYEEQHEGVFTGRNMAIIYVSQYRGNNAIYCNIRWYCRHNDILKVFFLNNVIEGKLST